MSKTIGNIIPPPNILIKLCRDQHLLILDFFKGSNYSMSHNWTSILYTTKIRACNNQEDKITLEDPDKSDCFRRNTHTHTASQNVSDV